MFHVKGIITSAECLMCGRPSECLEIEAPEQKIYGNLCLPDFKRLVRAANAKKPPDATAKSSGQ